MSDKSQQLLIFHTKTVDTFAGCSKRHVISCFWSFLKNQLIPVRDMFQYISSFMAVLWYLISKRIFARIDWSDPLYPFAELTVLIVRITNKWPMIKRPGREADHTASYSAEISVWSHSTSPDMRTLTARSLVNASRTVSVCPRWRAATVESCLTYTMNTFGGGVEVGPSLHPHS